MTSPSAPAPAPPPRVLLRREGVVVVAKPPGLPSTGRDLDDPDCVQGWLMESLGRRKVWAVHQLDRDTSGLNLFVTKKPLVPVWSEHLRSGRKRYLALSPGPGFHGERLVTVSIGRRRLGRRWWPCLNGSEPRSARSRVRTISASDTGSLLEVRIETGRTHQARLHLLSLDHPVLGEQQHVDPPDHSVPRLMLHAWRLELPGAPAELRELELAPPQDFRQEADRRGLHGPHHGR